MISSEDRGFLYGDSLFETVRLKGGELLWEERHYARMLNSARELGFKVERVDEAFEALHEASHQCADGLLRVTLSREGEGVAFGGEGSCHVRWRPCVMPDADAFRLCIVEGAYFPQDRLAEHKTGSYLRAVMVRREAVQRGFHDGVRVSLSGRVGETSTGNIFIVRRGGVVWTPCIEGILPGVMRSVVIERLRAQSVEVEEREVYVDDLRDGESEEVWVTNVAFGVRGVTEVDAIGFGFKFLKDNGFVDLLGEAS